VAVIGTFQLVLNQHIAIRGRVFAQNISAERPHILFLSLNCQFVQADGIRDKLDVVFLGQPRCK
jgi:hypothetical protein